MTKRLTIALVAISLGFLAAAPAHATIGSIISSFDIPGPNYGYGILAHPSYIYLSGYVTYGNYILTYTRSGSLLRSRSIDPGNQYGLISGSRTHLGPGYVALIDSPARYLKIFSIANGGAAVASFRIGIVGPWNCFWDGNYYYINEAAGRGRFLRYSRSGGYEGTWTCAGWPASMTYCRGAEYARRGNYGSGPYFVAGAGSPSRPYCMTTFPGGSLVATWSLPSPYLLHLSYGDSSNPGVYGAAIWATTSSPYDVREIDIDARGASAVMPASIGKVKAIYR
jgi:hypothetical protein